MTASDPKGIFLALAKYAYGEDNLKKALLLCNRKHKPMVQKFFDDNVKVARQKASSQTQKAVSKDNKNTAKAHKHAETSSNKGKASSQQGSTPTVHLTTAPDSVKTAEANLKDKPTTPTRPIAGPVLTAKDKAIASTNPTPQVITQPKSAVQARSDVSPKEGNAISSVDLNQMVRRVESALSNMNPNPDTKSPNTARNYISEDPMTILSRLITNSSPSGSQQIHNVTRFLGDEGYTVGIDEVTRIVAQIPNYIELPYRQLLETVRTLLDERSSQQSQIPHKYSLTEGKTGLDALIALAQEKTEHCLLIFKANQVYLVRKSPDKVSRKITAWLLQSDVANTEGKLYIRPMQKLLLELNSNLVANVYRINFEPHIRNRINNLLGSVRSFLYNDPSHQSTLSTLRSDIGNIIAMNSVDKDLSMLDILVKCRSENLTKDAVRSFRTTIMPKTTDEKILTSFINAALRSVFETESNLETSYMDKVVKAVENACIFTLKLPSEQSTLIDVIMQMLPGTFLLVQVQSRPAKRYLLIQRDGTVDESKYTCTSSDYDVRLDMYIRRFTRNSKIEMHFTADELHQKIIDMLGVLSYESQRILVYGPVVSSSHLFERSDLSSLEWRSVLNGEEPHSTINANMAIVPARTGFNIDTLQTRFDWAKSDANLQSKGAQDDDENQIKNETKNETTGGSWFPSMTKVSRKTIIGCIVGIFVFWQVLVCNGWFDRKYSIPLILSTQIDALAGQGLPSGAADALSNFFKSWSPPSSKPTPSNTTPPSPTPTFTATPPTSAPTRPSSAPTRPSSAPTPSKTTAPSHTPTPPSSAPTLEMLVEQVEALKVADEQRRLQEGPASFGVGLSSLPNFEDVKAFFTPKNIGQNAIFAIFMGLFYCITNYGTVDQDNRFRVSTVWKSMKKMTKDIIQFGKSRTQDWSTKKRVMAVMSAAYAILWGAGILLLFEILPDLMTLGTGLWQGGTSFVQISKTVFNFLYNGVKFFGMLYTVITVVHSTLQFTASTGVLGDLPSKLENKITELTFRKNPAGVEELTQATDEISAKIQEAVGKAKISEEEKSKHLGEMQRALSKNDDETTHGNLRQDSIIRLLQIGLSEAESAFVHDNIGTDVVKHEYRYIPSHMQPSFNRSVLISTFCQYINSGEWVAHIRQAHTVLDSSDHKSFFEILFADIKKLLEEPDMFIRYDENWKQRTKNIARESGEIILG